MHQRISKSLALTGLVSLLWPCQSMAQTASLNPTKTEIDAYLIADSNKDGALNRKEFETFVRLMAKSGQPTARRIWMFGAYRFAFGIADTNDDDIVTPQELRTADDAQ